MCNDCIIREKNLSAMLAPFLREGVKVEVLGDCRGDGYEEVCIIDTDTNVMAVLTAFGGYDGGKLFWEMDTSDLGKHRPETTLEYEEERTMPDLRDANITDISTIKARGQSLIAQLDPDLPIIDQLRKMGTSLGYDSGPFNEALRDFQETRTTQPGLDMYGVDDSPFDTSKPASAKVVSLGAARKTRANKE